MTFAPTGGPSPPEAFAAPSLLVIEDGSSNIHKLPESGEIVIGRAKDATLRLADEAVSRQHARLSLRPNGAYIEDLGSHNGVRVNGERILNGKELNSGDVISICGVTLVFQRPRYGVLVRPIHDSVTPLRQRLEEEVMRAAQTHRALSLVVLRLEASVSQRRALLIPTLSRVLRVIDVVAWEGESCLWVLLPELDEREASATAARLVTATESLSSAVRAGTATCPADGVEADALFAGARAALAAAPPGEVRSAANTMTTLRIGDRSIVVADPAMLRLYVLIERLAQGELPVLIHGETGSGKELAAQALHWYSKRRTARLLSINCAALPESLAESELFGYEKGAFSGAATSKIGYLEAAPGQCARAAKCHGVRGNGRDRIAAGAGAPAGEHPGR
jgi:pSer/pThr/pTyr-binding forkhead associated (FHA) protein